MGGGAVSMCVWGQCVWGGSVCVWGQCVHQCGGQCVCMGDQSVCVCVCERERERQTDRQTDTERERRGHSASLTVRDKVTRQCPLTTAFLKRKESRSGISRAEALLLTSLSPYR